MSIIPPGFLVHCLTGFQLLAHKSGIIVSDTDLMVFMLMMEMRMAMLVQSIQLLEYQMVWALCRFDINLVQTVAPGWRQIESEMALDLLIIPAVSALV